MAVPEQPWLDGFRVEEGLIRQFVAMPLGAGYTAEEQLTGEAEHGGLQIAAYPMLAATYEKWLEDQRRAYDGRVYSMAPPPPAGCQAAAGMGLAPGGLMRQKIYEDPHGFDAWDRSARSRCFVHILNSVQFLQVTGVKPPAKPPTAADYTRAGLPWFEHYGGDLTALDGAKKLAGLDSVGARKLKQGEGVLAGNDPVQSGVRQAGGSRPRTGGRVLSAWGAGDLRPHDGPGPGRWHRAMGEAGMSSRDLGSSRICSMGTSPSRNCRL